MTDGKFLGGGTTYGSTGTFYVWDGMYSLRLLIVGSTGVDTHLVGETEPGGAYRECFGNASRRSSVQVSTLMEATSCWHKNFSVSQFGQETL